MKEILLPTTTPHNIGNSTLTKYEFDDGTKVTEVQLPGADGPLSVLKNPDGSIVENPAEARHPSRTMVAQAALEYFDKTGHLPKLD